MCEYVRVWVLVGGWRVTANSSSHSLCARVRVCARQMPYISGKERCISRTKTLVSPFFDHKKSATRHGVRVA